MGRRRGYYEPEWLGDEQDERDASIPGRRYYVYILETDFGDYVGHTARLRSRIQEHKNGEVQSTVGGRPELAWYTRRPFQTRDDAASFEAALKALRQKRSPRYKEITGLEPEPFAHPAYAKRTIYGEPFRERQAAYSRDNRPERFSDKDNCLGKVMVMVGFFVGAILIGLICNPP